MINPIPIHIFYRKNTIKLKKKIIRFVLLAHIKNAFILQFCVANYINIYYLKINDFPKRTHAYNHKNQNCIGKQKNYNNLVSEMIKFPLFL